MGLAAYGTTKLATILWIKGKLSLGMLYNTKLGLMGLKIIPVVKAGVLTYAPVVIPTIAISYFGYQAFLKHIKPKYFPSPL